MENTVWATSLRRRAGGRSGRSGRREATDEKRMSVSVVVDVRTLRGAMEAVDRVL
jgi:hypothetical protein